MVSLQGSNPDNPKPENGSEFFFSVDGTNQESTGSAEHFLKMMTDELESLKSQILELNELSDLKDIVNQTGYLAEQSQIRLAGIVAGVGQDSEVAEELQLQMVVVQIGCVTLAFWALTEFLKRQNSSPEAPSAAPEAPSAN